MDLERKVVTLVQHYLHERGWTLALAALEEDAQIRFEANTLPSGALVALINERDAEAATRDLAALALRSRERREDDSALTTPGDRRIPNAPELTFNTVHPANVITVRPSPHEPWIITGGADRFVNILDLRNGNRLRSLYYHRAGVLMVDVHPTVPHLLLSCSMDGTHCLLDLSRADHDVTVKSWADHTKFVVRVQWSPDGKYFATASYDRTACLYGPRDGETYTLLHRYHFQGTVEAVAFSPDSAFVAFTARDDNYLHYVSLADGAVSRYNMNQNGDDFVSFVGMDVQFSPDGKYVLVCTDKSRIILFRAHSSDQVMNFYGMDHSEFSQPRTAWHPSGKYFYCTSGDRVIQAYEVASKSVLYTLEGHTSTVRDICYDRTRDCLWSCSYDQSVRQWVLDDAFVPQAARDNDDM